MWTRIAALPLFLLLVGGSALAMLVPAAIALVQEEHHISRSFFYAAILTLILTTFIAVALGPRASVFRPRDQLLTLLGTYVLLPGLLAVPFHEAVGSTTFLNAYFEMVSSLTTTGATLFEGAERLPPVLHLWRAMVAWLGGFFIWVVAVALLAPMNLGGFEITSAAEPGETLTSLARESGSRDAMGRMGRAIRSFTPIYLAITLALWVLLLIAGDGPLVSLCHAMSTVSTSGISPQGGLSFGASGLVGEAFMFVFLFFGVTRLVAGRETGHTLPRQLYADPEFRFAIGLLLLVPGALFLRHWFGAIEVNEGADAVSGLRALWGSLFTALSFLTTTGFVSTEWETASGWSGLPTPGLILVGLALIGGGVATTAGGVKLLRVFALYLHGLREIDRLVHPSSVAAGGRLGRRIRRQGAFIAWIFFMLFALSITAVVLALATTGVRLDDAMILAVATLSTTGPLLEVASETGLSYRALTDPAKLLLGAAMVLGRLETLAIIALFNPNFWRR
ncbi:trk system potassium uptake protein TrkH [Poseidonocella pacifica]|uniref:Trk system potassium uptake protein TrkH n=1 Tax=Poseidonocella pacifica TaxID=871651 RepID=A0A1I0WK97_9RHOB|nr:potassium transporter TrkG [Poseidonocella pacifica]SFA88648.1 trk system potassium uptake protein TrkH [Poseidonocella pacifica]